MTYKVIYHPDVLKEDLSTIPANIKKRIRKAIENRLFTEPILSGKPLRQSLKGHRRIRVGDWRIIYLVEGSTVIVLKVGNRKDVYQKVFRRLR